ncbi:hypothetical protein AB1Y20_002967 [Prymnesium parvum]|uniref:Coenzyme Q-binding protein COQ10 START domain-containing protein n=1 Tax=Prymnesium parvum TaxID=97485 RepID=A0AB34JCQ4_PRYPA
MAGIHRRLALSLALFAMPLAKGITHAPAHLLVVRPSVSRQHLVVHMMMQNRKRKRDILFNLFKKARGNGAEADETPSPWSDPPADDVVVEVSSTVPEDVATAAEDTPALPPPPPPSPPPPLAPAAKKAGSPDSAEKEMVVNCPMADVFEVVTDFEKYPSWVTGLKKVNVLERFEDSGRGKVVEFSAGAMSLSISYTLSYTLHEPDEVSWVSVAGGVKSIVGQYKLSPMPGDQTLVQYRLDVDAGFGIPGPVRKAVTNLVIGAALPDLKRYLENEYGKRK